MVNEIEHHEALSELSSGVAVRIVLLSGTRMYDHGGDYGTRSYSEEDGGRESMRMSSLVNRVTLSNQENYYSGSTNDGKRSGTDCPIIFIVLLFIDMIEFPINAIPLFMTMIQCPIHSIV